MEDRDPPLMDDFFYISDQSVSTFALRDLERRVLTALQFRLHRLSPFHFVTSFLRAGRACQDMNCTFHAPVQYNLTLYLITLGRLSYSLSRYSPSVLTAAAVYLSRVTLGITHTDIDKEEYGKYWSPLLVQHTGYTKDDLKNPVFLLYNYQLKAEELNVAVFQQFSKAKFDCVSLRTAPRVEDLDFGSPVLYDDLDVEP